MANFQWYSDTQGAVALGAGQSTSGVITYGNVLRVLVDFQECMPTLIHYIGQSAIIQNKLVSRVMALLVG